jgi:hypothetical protein
MKPPRIVGNCIKNLISKLKSRLTNTIRKFRKIQIKRKEFNNWKKSGCPVPPPPVVKQKVIKEYAKRYKLKTFVETGTYLGEMVEAVRNSFDKIFSVELSYELFEKAKKKFVPFKHIFIINGDSSKIMRRILSEINGPAIFWLDGHYSGGITARGEKETPIQEELSVILNYDKRKHVIIIDDARLFGVDKDYPPLSQILDFVNSNRDDLDVMVKDDMIRITPKTTS